MKKHILLIFYKIVYDNINNILCQNKKIYIPEKCLSGWIYCETNNLFTNSYSLVTQTRMVL